MMRGTFANIRIRNEHARQCRRRLHPLRADRRDDADLRRGDALQAGRHAAGVLAGKEYGTGSSRDWAAKGTVLLGVRAVIAESFERIHRSNLVGMGVLPLQFRDGETAESLGLDGSEKFSIAASPRSSRGRTSR
jgi:aconitate hydratase